MIIDTKNINGFRERYSINKNGKEHGFFRYWHSNGNLYLEINCKDGKQHGLYRSWYSNGNLDRKSTRLNSSHITRSRMPSSA